MKGLNPAEVGAYVKTALARDYGRLLGSRFFQGTLRAVEQQAGAATFLVTLSRTGEIAADGNLYLCATPGYFPRIGDVVECVWLDNTVALVLWPVAGAQLGSLGYVQVVANQAGITTEVDLTGLTKDVILGTRKVRIAWQLIALSTVAGDQIVLQVIDTFNGVATVVGQGWMVSQGVSLNQTFPGSTIVTPTPGTHSYKLTLQRFAGTGSVSMIAALNTPAYISVEGIGG